MTDDVPPIVEAVARRKVELAAIRQVLAERRRAGLAIRHRRKLAQTADPTNPERHGKDQPMTTDPAALVFTLARAAIAGLNTQHHYDVPAIVRARLLADMAGAIGTALQALNEADAYDAGVKRALAEHLEGENPDATVQEVLGTRTISDIAAAAGLWPPHQASTTVPTPTDPDIPPEILTPFRDTFPDAAERDTNLRITPMTDRPTGAPVVTVTIDGRDVDHALSTEDALEAAVTLIAAAVLRDADPMPPSPGDEPHAM